MRTAVLIAPMFEESELIYPYYRLQEAGHDTFLVGAEPGRYPGKNGLTLRADRGAADVDPADLDAVVVPGGYAPDHIRRSSELIDLVGEIGSAGRPVGAICHAPWVLVSAGLAQGRRMTSFFSLRDDVVNAGADWVDEEVVVDGNVVTSRHPGDLPAFMKAFLTVMDSAAQGSLQQVGSGTGT